MTQLRGLLLCFYVAEHAQCLVTPFKIYQNTIDIKEFGTSSVSASLSTFRGYEKNKIIITDESALQHESCMYNI